MTRLHEYKGKELLKEMGIKTAPGYMVKSANEAEEALKKLGTSAVIKAQVFTTGRAGKGLIRFIESPEEAKNIASKMLDMDVDGLKIDKLLIEEKLLIKEEFYGGVILDDNAKAPVIIFSSMGGTGIEEIAEKFPDKVSKAPVDIIKGLKDFKARNIVRKTGVSGKKQMKLAQVLVNLFELAKKYDARSAEINPIAICNDGNIYAADCRITIDDYAVHRHPELGIEIARELGHPPTPLDKIAYDVEAGDYRGTFYFIQMADGFNKGDKYIGFHGAGGGGSMMSMDALINRDYKIANFCDTSGNPPASKVYRAAKIILAQSGIDGYFASGSGVASQEQFHSARGFAKVFMEEQLNIPAIIRLGGNSEEIAIDIINTYGKFFPAKIEGYGRDDTPAFCAERLSTLLEDKAEKEYEKVDFPVKINPTYSFETITGKIEFDHEKCLNCKSKACIEACSPKILKIVDEKAVLAISTDDAKKGKCTECLACELECFLKGEKAIRITLPIQGLDDYRKKVMS